jgi:hypothetical protein
MTQKTGKFSVADEKSAVTEQMSLLQADRSRFEDQYRKSSAADCGKPKWWHMKAVSFSGS